MLFVLSMLDLFMAGSMAQLEFSEVKRGYTAS